MNCVKEFRAGQFCVSQKDLREHAEVMPSLFRHVVVVKAESSVLGCEMDVKYTAYSPLFDAIERGGPIPEYTTVFNEEGFTHFSRLPAPHERAAKKIRGQQELIKEMLLLISKAPLSDEAKYRVDVDKVKDFLARHAELM
jgi:uncharacterized protein (DUF952 family)